jgi:2-polyprenyl-3-methyl-5-hydroxy-6-metoxy-1,4-benzoquinol methylase
MSTVRWFIKQHDFICWCGESKSRRVCDQMFGRRPFVVLECANCGTHRILPKALETQASAELLYNEYEGPVFSDLATARYMKGMLKRFRETGVQFEKSWKVLDVGCGTGVLLETLCQKFGCTGKGIDVDRRRILMAKARSQHASFECGLFNATDIHEKYDALISCAVIEHVVNPLGFLKQLHVPLAEGGSLFLLTPNARSLNYRLLRSWWRELLSIGEHIYLFTPQSLELCAEQAGFKLVKASSDYDLGWTIPRLGGLRTTLIAFWSLHREIVKRASSYFASSGSRDILYAHFQKTGTER